MGTGAGATVWITGLPAAGKTTLATALEAALLCAGRAACVLDGDELRRGLSSDLGFAPADRDEQVRRAAEVAQIVAHAGLIAIAALVSPRRRARDAARRVHLEHGLPFIEVWADADASTCAQRDPKGLYRRARMGAMEGLTGVDSPYEPPVAADVIVAGRAVEDVVAEILGLLPLAGASRWARGAADPRASRRSA